MYFTKKLFLVKKSKYLKRRRQDTHEAAATSMIMIHPLNDIFPKKILGSQGVSIPPSGLSSDHGVQSFWCSFGMVWHGVASCVKLLKCSGVMCGINNIKAEDVVR